NQHTLADTSIRTQARLIGSNAWWFALLARFNFAAPSAYVVLMKNNARLEIWRFGPSASSSWMLASANVGIDPREQDILLRFDVIGNELSAWTWREGDPMPAEPQVRAVHSEFATGIVGVAADLGSRLSNNDAIFRYVEVYEPVLPPPDFNGDEIVDIEDLIILIEHWGLDEPSLDIAPPHFGDGIVDVQDLEVLMSYWQQEVLPVSLLAYWKLDQEAGDIASDSSSEYDGTLNGQPVWQPTGGQINGTLEFDGINDYVSTPFILDPAKGSLSALAWINGGAPDQVIISQTGDFGGTLIGIDPSEGTLMTEFSDMYFGALVSETVVTDGQWHHIGLVYDLDSLHRRIYVDGAHVAEDATVVSGLPSDGGLHIGAGKELNAGTFFSGLIDDIRIYDVALTAEEIAALAR
ncbi:LamG-like jellyroll fold domain-containing protein, partial [Planctomycetota bacterium]